MADNSDTDAENEHGHSRVDLREESFEETETGFKAMRRIGKHKVEYSYQVKNSEMFIQAEYYEDGEPVNDSSERIQLTEDGQRVKNSEYDTVEEFCRADFEKFSKMEIRDIVDIIKTRTNSETVEAFKADEFRERAKKYWSNDWWRDIPVAEDDWARIQEHPLRGVARYTTEPPEKVETVIRSYGEVGNYTTNIPSEFAIYLDISGGERITVSLECRDGLVIVLRKVPPGPDSRNVPGREVSTQESGPHGNQVRFFMPKGTADALELDGRKLTWRMGQDEIIIEPGEKMD